MERTARATAVVVDDEPPIVNLVCDTLANVGINAVPCEHGREAYLCILDKCPRVVILDIQMPVVDGIQVFELMRADPATVDIPVVFFTANAHILRQQLPNYTKMNAQFLPKPFDLDALITAVEAAIIQ